MKHSITDNLKGNVSLFLLAVILLVITGGLIVLAQNQQSGNETVSQNANDPNLTLTVTPTPTLKPIKTDSETMQRMLDAKIEQSRNTPNNSNNQNLYEKVLGHTRALNTTLGTEENNNANGTAYLLRNNNQLFHIVSAQLPKPDLGTVYQGWLAKNPHAEEYISTGVMLLQEEGRCMLEYSAEEDYEGYDTVVITAESEVDNTPEKHVLQGSF